MTATPDPLSLAAAVSGLAPKVKAPASARILDGWIARAESQLGADGGRLGWLVASTIVAAALQQAVDHQQEPLFLIKDGTLLQHLLPHTSRATTDLDGLVRGDIDRFVDLVDETLSTPWGPCTLQRGPVTVIETPHRVVRPRRFDVVVQLRGATWRRVQVEIAADEGSAGSTSEPVAAPSLAGFGLPTPDHLAGLALRYQIAQKVHAATDPHEPPTYINDRARDVVDLLLLRDLCDASGSPSRSDVRAAVLDVFRARAADATYLGLPPRHWPSRVTAHPHWTVSYESAARSAGLSTSLDAAVEAVNTWLDRLDE